MWQPITICSSSSRESLPFQFLWVRHMHTVHTYTFRQNTHTHRISKPKFPHQNTRLKQTTTTTSLYHPSWEGGKEWIPGAHYTASLALLTSFQVSESLLSKNQKVDVAWSIISKVVFWAPCVHASACAHTHTHSISLKEGVVVDASDQWNQNR